MGHFYDTQLKVFLKDRNTPDYINDPRYVRCENPPAVPISYWKVENGAVVEMTQLEKDAVDSELETARLNNKSYEELELEVQMLFTGTADEESALDFLDKYYRSLYALSRAKRWDKFRARIEKAVVRGDLTVAMKDAILTKVP